jgi:2-haloalkanoic acid dehalogenase type II
MRGVKAVIFDLGGTLIRTADHAVIFQRILAANGLDVSVDEIRRAQERAGEEMSRETEAYAALGDEFWNQWNRRVLELIGVEHDTAGVAQKLTREWFEYADVTLYPGVSDVLRQLKRHGIQLALVTNGLQSDLDAILPRVGLTRVFDLVVATDAVGKPKPDPAMFSYAMTALGVEAKDVLCVGDDPEKDCECAARLGVPSLLIDWEGTYPREPARIVDLRALLPLLEIESADA